MEKEDQPKADEPLAQKTEAESEMEERIAKRERKTKKRMPMSGKQVFDIEKEKRKRGENKKA